MWCDFKCSAFDLLTGVNSQNPRIIWPQIREKFHFRQSYALPAITRDALLNEDQSSGYGTKSLDTLDQVQLFLCFISYKIHQVQLNTIVLNEVLQEVPLSFQFIIIYHLRCVGAIITIFS